MNAPRRPGPDGAGGDEARDECTPLHLCCQWGLEQVVQTLIEHGADVNVRDAEGKTPVHVAIQNQHSQIISLLLCHPNIDLNKRDKKGLTPFATALTVRNNKAAQAILERLPKAAEQYDNKGRNFLHTAIQKGDMESILFLLSIQVLHLIYVNSLLYIKPVSTAGRLFSGRRKFENTRRYTNASLTSRSRVRERDVGAKFDSGGCSGQRYGCK